MDAEGLKFRRDLVCTVCGHDQFARRRGLLSRIMSRPAFFRNQWAEVFICARCGYIHIFEARRRPKR